MISYTKISAIAAMAALAAATGPACADMVPAMAYVPGAMDLIPAGFSFLVWLLVAVPTAGCAAGLFWLIRSDRQRTAGRPVKSAVVPAAAGGTLRLSV